MNILALDIATTVGWAANNGDQHDYGHIILATPKELREQRKTRGDRRGDIRVERFFWWLKVMGDKFQPDIIVYEDVEFASSRMWVQLWSSLRAAVWLVVSRSYSNPVIDCVNVKTLKKFSTGSGSADKVAMIAAARLNPGKFDIRPKLTDDESDAIHLHHWGHAHYNL